MGSHGIEGLVEHHTGLVDLDKMESLLYALADGTLKREDVFADMGHGALMYDSTRLALGSDDFDVVVTGPRRGLFQHSQPPKKKPSLRPYYPAPFGDMMITGCFGLLRATADLMPDLTDTISTSLYPASWKGVAPWDLQ
jgi:uncharacterized protein (DUF1786 family)